MQITVNARPEQCSGHHGSTGHLDRLPYFPFGQSFDLRMGTVAYKATDRLVEVDDAYHGELAEKERLLAQDHRYYYQASPETEPAQWELIDILLQDMAVFRPEDFRYERDGSRRRWFNGQTGTERTFVAGDKSTLPYDPLDWLGREMQEDLMLLSNDASATLVAGQLCFANGYALDDRRGKSFLAIHAPTPGTVSPTIDAARRLMEKLPPGRPIWRASWNFKVSAALDQSTRHNEAYGLLLAAMAPGLTAENIGERLFIRIERQTLLRLPETGYVLFAIHTYQNTLAGEAVDRERAAGMLGVLRTTPEEMLRYKAILPFREALEGYLSETLQNSG